MTRLERKNRTDIEYKERGSLFDIFDNEVKSVWRINDEEYDYLCEMEAEDYICIDEKSTYSEVKEAISKINEHLSNFHNENKRRVI